jgi:hypothetical protein
MRSNQFRTRQITRQGREEQNQQQQKKINKIIQK